MSRSTDTNALGTLVTERAELGGPYSGVHCLLPYRNGHGNADGLRLWKGSYLRHTVRFTSEK